MSSTSSTSAVDPERAKESNTAMILAVTGTFHALALVFVVLRTYTRAAIVKTIGIDDYMMIMSAQARSSVLLKGRLLPIDYIRHCCAGVSQDLNRSIPATPK
ncbi:hypothetical protein COL5a_001688 [Colletotrichum fioriniae]|nr:hypothetical protein COL5a_001688 [Colletotrichum fioriniae]